MFAEELSSGTYIGLAIAVLTVLVAPTWLSYWNSRVQKKDMRTNGGTSFRDDFNKLVKTVDTHSRKLDSHTTQLHDIKKNQADLKEDMSRIDKDHLLIGFALGVRGIGKEDTGEVPITEGEPIVS